MTTNTTQTPIWRKHGYGKSSQPGLGRLGKSRSYKKINHSPLLFFTVTSARFCTPPKAFTNHTNSYTPKSEKEEVKNEKREEKERERNGLVYMHAL